ncbi:MAG: type II toxin-antitoxin system PemK/MazF family toxin [Phycisphaerales bacterium]|nr:type II toxin-antitoxin system PemK/MazF family toxin [Phycisphaerales bacterium]
MTPCSPGDVILVRFPFTDLASSKKRPALVLSPSEYFVRHQDVVVLALTSQPQPEDDFRLQAWKQAGLPKPSWFKPILATLSMDVFLRRLGTLAEADCVRAAEVVSYMIAEPFRFRESR